MVIWTLAILAAIAVGVTAVSRSDLAIARNVIDAAQAQAAADGGVWWGVAQRLDKETADSWRGDGVVHQIAIGGETVDIAAQDEGGKVDLRYADPQLIGSLMRTIGVNGSTTDTLVAAIMAIRATKDSTPDTSDDNDSPLHATIDADIANRLKPFTTAYTGRAGINPATAPEAVLRSIPGVDPSDVTGYLRLRAQLPAGIGPLQDFPSLAAAVSYFSWADSGVVTVIARAHCKAASYTRSAVIDFAPQSRRPYDVLAWSTSP